MAHDNDEYETSDPLTMGGPSGNYVIPSPYHTECEWAIVSAVGIGTMGSSGSYAVGSKNPTQPSITGAVGNSFGNVITSSPDNNNALQSYVGALTATAPMMTYGGDNYMPLPSPSYVYAAITAPASSGIFVTIQFRRKLDREIPDMPRPKPQSHSHVGARRGQRSMMAGFASQYPEEGQPYQHEQIPLSQDTSMNKRGVSPLQPTTNSHRGVGGKNGRNR